MFDHPSARYRVAVARACTAITVGWFVATSSAGAQTPEERCLIDAVRSARPDARVEPIRAQCREVGARVPDAIGPAPDESHGRAGNDAVVSSASETPAGAGLKLAPAAEPGLVVESPVRRRISEEFALWDQRFALLPHRPNYIDPVSHAFVAQGAGDAPDAAVQRNEIKFQLSFKLPLTQPLLDGRAAVFFAYTGQAWWQAFNEDRSSPFREYNHEPEVYVSWVPRTRLLGWDWRLASAGFVHQSNGRSGTSSRSWNRLFAELRFDRPGPWWIGLRPWWRIPEDRKSSPDSPLGDDNPRIARFVGDGELRIGHVGEVHQWTLMLRRSLAGAGKGAVQIDYSRPTGFSPRLRWHLQYFDGYGESLIDYQTRMRRVGFGVMLNDWY